MPRKSAKRIKRRAPRRNKSKYYSTSSMPRTLRAPALFTKMKYCAQISITTASVPIIHVFRGNGMFDPDFTGAGHQPMGFDQYAMLYNKWIVYGSSIKLVGSSDSVSANIYFGVCPQKTATFGGSLFEAQERNNSKYRVTTHERPQTLRAYQTSGGMLGINKNALLNDWGDYGGKTTVDPSQQWYWVIYAQDNNLVTNSTLRVNVELTYYVKLMEPKTLASS